MPTTSAKTAPLALKPAAGCGTLESPWTGWEEQLERVADTDAEFVLAPGFYGVARPVRLAGDVLISVDRTRAGRAWFLPAGEETLDALFVVDGAERITAAGISLNGRGHRAKHGIHVRAGGSILLSGIRFEDFQHPEGAAVRIEGENAARPAQGLVVQACRFRNGHCGLRFGRHASDVLVDDNLLEEITGPSVLIDPEDEWSDYGLIFVKNRLRTRRAARTAPFVDIRPGAEGIRVAENTLEVDDAAAPADAPAMAIEGGGPLSRRRLELLMNRIVGSGGPGIRARRCGPGFVAAGNELLGCGNAEEGSTEFLGCHGVLVEDNEVFEPVGPAIRLRDCTAARLNGNEVQGAGPSAPRGGTVGVLVEGEGTRRVRLTDNRVRGVREDGVRVLWSAGVRLVGNEVEDCGHGIRVERARNLLLVGNDCRDNGAGGILVAAGVRRGRVTLNYAILNGTFDLEVQGTGIRCRNNKVDREQLSAAE